MLLFSLFPNPRAPRNRCNPREVQGKSGPFLILNTQSKLLNAHVTHARGYFSAYYTFRFAPRVATTHRRVTHAVMDFNFFRDVPPHTPSGGFKPINLLSVVSVLSVPSVSLFPLFPNPRVPRNPCNPREVQGKSGPFLILNTQSKLLNAHVTHARGCFVTYYTFRFAPRVAITLRRVTHATIKS